MTFSIDCLLLEAYAKLRKEITKPKLITSGLHGGSRWLGKWQRGLKDVCLPHSVFTSLQEESISEKGEVEVA